MSDLLDRFRGKRILIWGYGREGKSTEDFFKAHPVAASVEVSEQKPDEIDLTPYDVVFKSPGIRLKYPTLEGFAPAQSNQRVLDEMNDGRGDHFRDEWFDKLTSQTEFFISCFRDRVIGITGTKGKSTTTSLLWHVLDTCFRNRGRMDAGDSYPDTLPTNAYLVGNIGVPCLDYFDDMANGNGIAVFELSCHQLAYSRVSPHVAIFLNLYEDHLDFYGDRATYFMAKRHITEFQTERDCLYLGEDVPELTTDATVRTVTERYTGQMKLLGEHNRLNAAFVRETASGCFGLPMEYVDRAISGFTGLSHRLEYIGSYGGIRYYDDSISTIPEASLQAIDSVPGIGTVLIGGMDRDIDYTPLVRAIPKMKDINFICMYASGERICRELTGGADAWLPGRADARESSAPISESLKNVFYVPDLEAAVELARVVTPVDRACVLSPAAASYGYFKNFEERGDKFASLVKQ